MDQDNSGGRLAAELRDLALRSAPGDRMPSARELVRTHRVSPHTVTAALADLRAEGLVVSRPGAGTFVAARRPQVGPAPDRSWQAVVLGDRVLDTAGLSPLADPPEAEGMISLATGYLHPSLAPGAALATALRRVSRQPSAWARPPATGLHRLRAWFAALAGDDAGADDVVVTAGGQRALSTAMRAILAPGAPILVESPTYPGAIAAARAAGLRTVPAPVDDGGMIPHLAARALGGSRAQAIYLQPRHANPTGASLLASRRAEVLAMAAAVDAFVIEDDCGRWLGHGDRISPPLFADDREGRVVYVTSLTKVASPSLRVGAVVARGPVAERIRALHAAEELFVTSVNQEVALEIVGGPTWERHQRQLNRALSGRARALASAVARMLPALEVTAPVGGAHLWTRLPAGTDDAGVVAAARAAGVTLMPGRPFYPAEPDGGHLRLTLSAASSEAAIEEGVRRLAHAVPALSRR